MAGASYIDLSMTMSRDWPKNSRINIYSSAILLDNLEYGPSVPAVLDTTTPLNSTPIPAWSSNLKGGQGCGPQGDYPQGNDGGGISSVPAWKWSSKSSRARFRDGDYFWSIRLVSETGIEGTPNSPTPFQVQNVPRAPSELEFVSYVAGTTTLSLSFRPSKDVERFIAHG